MFLFSVFSAQGGEGKKKKKEEEDWQCSGDDGDDVAKLENDNK